MLISGGLGAAMLSLFTRTDSAQRLRDLEAFVGVGLVWPLTVLIGALPYWFGGVFVGPFVDDALLIDILRGLSTRGLSRCPGSPPPERPFSRTT